MMDDRIMVQDEFAIRCDIKQKRNLSEKIRKKVIESVSLAWKLQKDLNTLLVKFFQKLGQTIGERTSHFIIVPFLLCCLCATGFQQMVYEDNFEELALPKKGDWVKEREIVEKNFPMTSWNFDPIRATVMGRYVNVLITPKVGSNLFADILWEEVQHLDKTISETSIFYENEDYNFFDLCMKWKGRCFSPLYPIKANLISKIYGFLQKFPPLSDLLKQPIWKVNFFLAYPFGGSRYSRQEYLESVEAISLYYWVRSDHYVDIKRSRKWEKRIMDLLSEYQSQNISVEAYASRTPNDELRYAGERVKPLLALSVLLIVVFTAISASMTDWVRSKILVSLLGIASSLIATAAAFGILMYWKVPFIEMNLATVFLMLGIGIDDMFVILAAWRGTSLKDSISKRMSETYEHACVSITITSLTNMLAFWIGSFTSIRSIEIFCIYSCVSVLMMLLIFLTFFGGCLAASGYLERNQRHSLFCIKVLPKSESQMKRRWYRSFMSGGINPLNSYDKQDNQPHFGMKFLRDYWGGFLCRRWVKGSTVFVFMAYMIISLYGVSTLEVERHPNREEFLPSSKSYFSVYDLYFNHKALPVQVIITGKIDYSDQDTVKEIFALHQQLEAESFVLENFTISWIRDWYNYLERHKEVKLNITNEESFVRFLRTVKDTDKSTNRECADIINQFSTLKNWIFRVPDFANIQYVKEILSFMEDLPCNARDIFNKLVVRKELKLQKEFFEVFKVLLWMNDIFQKYDDFYELDIKFRSDLSGIETSRFLIFVEDSQSEYVQRKLREIGSRFPRLGIEIFSNKRLVMDEMFLVKKTTIMTTVSTTLVVLLVSFILIPNPMCSMWVAFSILSIEVGVIGFMALWNVRLDSVSMVNLVMCIGFSVDFSAHICYAFLDVKASNVDGRICESIYAVGFPILLGGLSTIIGLVPLWFSDSSVFVKFFKIVFLVIFLGMVHAMSFLPVFMSFMNFKSKKKLSKPIIVGELSERDFQQVLPALPSICETKFLCLAEEGGDRVIYRGDSVCCEALHCDPGGGMVLNASSLAMRFQNGDHLDDKSERF